MGRAMVRVMIMGWCSGRGRGKGRVGLEERAVDVGGDA